MKKRLPIGIQNFKEIREEHCYYVDKTPFALSLVNQGKYFFLSRPRRFGKSLFLDTLKELFEGNRNLFSGLYAEDNWDWSVQYPVIHISFGAGVIRDRKDLERGIRTILRFNRERLGIACVETDRISSCFAEMIRNAHQQTGRRVVVLVDEYDKPILDRIEDEPLALDIREGLRDLYSVIKDADAHIKFVFLTGVSKFSKVSLFSGLNNLQDITLDGRYSAICGYTEEDVDKVFAPELEGLDRGRIRSWYNGYNWTGTTVYNPFDLLLLFDSRQFRPYWFETGTPTFLIHILIRHRFFTPDLARLQSSFSMLSAFDVGAIAPEALLFQTGYLTIHSCSEPMPGYWVYTLGYPNREVESSLNAAMISAYGVSERFSSTARLQLIDLLKQRNFSGLRDVFQSFFAGIPHQWYTGNTISRYEGFYVSVFYSYFAALGLDIRPEESTSHGRIDMAVIFDGQVFLFEFKVVGKKPTGKAIRQLRELNYADKYRALNCPVHLVGVEFSKTDRNIVGFDAETI